MPLVQWRSADLRIWLLEKGFAKAAECAPAWMAGRDVARLSRAAVTSVLCLGDAASGERLHKALRDEHHAALTQIIEKQNETSLKLAVCIDRNSEALKDCAFELRRFQEGAVRPVH